MAAKLRFLKIQQIPWLGITSGPTALARIGCMGLLRVSKLLIECYLCSYQFIISLEAGVSVVASVEEGFEAGHGLGLGMDGVK